MKQSILLLTMLTLSFSSIGQPIQKPNCSILKDGTFRYLDIEDATAYFIMKGNNHSEYHEKGKYNIKSKIRWLNECQYKMTMQSSTVPNFPFKSGDIMTVTITQVKGKTIYYTSEVNGYKWNGRLLKIK